MATFLDLARDVARGSGTTAGTAITSVNDATERLAIMIGFTREAWTDIQNAKADWLWMRDEFTAPLTIGQTAYTGADLGLLRYKSALGRDRCLSAYETAKGRNDEGFLIFVPWADFRMSFMVGSRSNDTGKPTYYTVDPQRRVVVHPAPDVECTLRGEYRRTPQVLENDGDVPEMPEEYHSLIKWTALILLAAHDESISQLAVWEPNRRRIMGELVRDQLPNITYAGPLA